MAERSVGISLIVEQLKSGERPIDQLLANALDQLYYSNQYRFAIVEGDTDLDPLRTLNCVRLVCIDKDALKSYVLSLTGNKQRQRRQLDTIVRETNRLPVKSHLEPFQILEETALEALEQSRLLTVGAMTLSTVSNNKKDRVEVIYPKPFMDIFPLPGISKEDLGLGVSMYFLNKVPFGKGNISIILPSH